MKPIKQTPLKQILLFSNQSKKWLKHHHQPSSYQCLCKFSSGSLFINPKTNPQRAFNAYVETCISLLNSCINQSWIKEGRTFHGHLIKMGISTEKYVAIKLLIMYLNAKKSAEAEELLSDFGGFDLVAWNCMINAQLQDGKFEEARLMFDEMPERNAVSWCTLIAGFMRMGRVDESILYFRRNPFRNVILWTTMISGFVQNGLNFEALKLFREMLRVGIVPNAVTFTSVVKACVGLGDFESGRCALDLIVTHGLESNVSVCNSIISLHLKMGEIELARKVFNRMEEKDIVSWTVILDVYVEMGEMIEARRIFDEMPEKNEVSWSAMISRYSQNGDAEEALELFHQMLREDFKPNVSCFSSILSVLANLSALPLGNNIHGHLIKIGLDDDVFVGSSLIDMYCKSGKTEDGHRAFHSMPSRNVVCWNSMVSGYSSNGQLEEARELFDQIVNKNTVSWNTMITGYVQNEHCDKVLEVFEEMLNSGGMPDGSTFSSVLRACASLASLEKGKNIHGKIIKLGIQDQVFMGTALTDMYAKSGDIQSSRRVFSAMHEKNEISWTAMIQGLAENGFAQESVAMFEEMVITSAVAPTELVFLAVLFACSHCGLVDKGLQYFESMETVYGIKPRGRHYTCMVDLLARSGRLSEAEEFIRTMPFQPEANAWAALLSGCSTYKNEEMAERTASKLWELAEESSAGYVLLSNIYASVGRWCDVSKVRKLMREKRLKKVSGCSWIEVRNQVHSFYCEDACHSQATEVYWILELLISEMTVVKNP